MRYVHESNAEDEDSGSVTTCGVPHHLELFHESDEKSGTDQGSDDAEGIKDSTQRDLTQYEEN